MSRRPSAADARADSGASVPLGSGRCRPPQRLGELLEASPLRLVDLLQRAGRRTSNRMRWYAAFGDHLCPLLGPRLRSSVGASGATRSQSIRSKPTLRRDLATQQGHKLNMAQPGARAELFVSSPARRIFDQFAVIAIINSGSGLRWTVVFIGRPLLQPWELAGGPVR